MLRNTLHDCGCRCDTSVTSIELNDTIYCSGKYDCPSNTFNNFYSIDNFWYFRLWQAMIQMLNFSIILKSDSNLQKLKLSKILWKLWKSSCYFFRKKLDINPRESYTIGKSNYKLNWVQSNKAKWLNVSRDLWSHINLIRKNVEFFGESETYYRYKFPAFLIHNKYLDTFEFTFKLSPLLVWLDFIL